MTTRAIVSPVIIRPSSGWVPLRLADLWEYRELLYFLIWRDIKVRYRQTVVGVAWAILQPLLTMVVFTVVFVLSGYGVVKVLQGFWKVTPDHDK